MKKWLMITMLAAALMLSACALGEGAVLMLELPEDAQMTENIAFEDGDFIQTYQLNDGVTVQLLRYAAFPTTLEQLARGEWAGFKSMETMDVAEIGGNPAQGVKLRYREDSRSVTVFLLLVNAQEQTLILEAVFPDELGEGSIDEIMNGWLETMDVYDPDETEVG